MKYFTIFALVATPILASYGGYDDYTEKCKEGSKKCEGNTLKTCTNGNWVSKACQPYSIDDMRFPAKCVTEGANAYCECPKTRKPCCKDGQTKCEGNTLSTCVKGTWKKSACQAFTACGGQRFPGTCVTEGGKSFCQCPKTKKCCRDGEKKCAGNALSKCVAGQWKNEDCVKNDGYSTVKGKCKTTGIQGAHCCFEEEGPCKGKKPGKYCKGNGLLTCPGNTAVDCPVPRVAGVRLNSRCKTLPSGFGQCEVYAVDGFCANKSEGTYCNGNEKVTCPYGPKENCAGNSSGGYGEEAASRVCKSTGLGKAECRDVPKPPEPAPGYGEY